MRFLKSFSTSFRRSPSPSVSFVDVIFSPSRHSCAHFPVGVPPPLGDSRSPATEPSAFIIISNAKTKIEFSAVCAARITGVHRTVGRAKRHYDAIILRYVPIFCPCALLRAANILTGRINNPLTSRAPRDGTHILYAMRTAWRIDSTRMRFSRSRDIPATRTYKTNDNEWPERDFVVAFPFRCRPPSWKIAASPGIFYATPHDIIVELICFEIPRQNVEGLECLGIFGTWKNQRIFVKFHFWEIREIFFLNYRLSNFVFLGKQYLV